MRMSSRVLLRVVPFAAMASIVIAGQATPPAAGGTATQPAQTQPTQTQPPAGRAAGPRGTPPAPARGGGGMLAGAGPSDKPPVDSSAADRGRTVYGAECATCHRDDARGTPNGPNLVRSLVVLRDRYGSELGPFLKRGHKMQSGAPARAPDRRADRRPRAFPAPARERFAARVANLPGAQRADRRSESGSGVFQRRRQVQHVPSADGNSASRDRFTRTGRSAAAVPVSGHRPRGRAGRAGAPPASAVTVTVTPPTGESPSPACSSRWTISRCRCAMRPGRCGRSPARRS